MNANELIKLIRGAGASSDAEVLDTLNNKIAMRYILGLPPFDQNDAEIITAHYEALRVVKTAYQIVMGGY